MITSLSAAGLAFIEAHEGFRDRLYNDANGYATIGYGHLVHKGAVGTNPQAEAPYVNGLPRAAAAVLLAKDTLAAAAGVKTFIFRPLQQTEFDALVSFTFNVGVGALMKSTLARRVNSNATPDAIESAFLMWLKPKSLEGRRRAEVELFLRGNYGGPVS